MTHHLSRTTNLVLGLVGCIVSTACSGGGTSSANAVRPDPNRMPTGEAHLIQYTSGGVEGRLWGRLATLFLEDESGELTDSLLVDTDAEWVLSDPAGTTVGLDLEDLRPGRYVALHLAFLPGSLKLDSGPGQVADAVIAGGGIRAPFDGVMTVRIAGAYRLELQHRSPIKLDRDGQGGWVCAPDLVANPAGAVVLRDVPVEILDVDPRTSTAISVLTSIARIRTNIHFLSDAVVLLDGVQTSVERFLAALGAHDMIRVCGLLDGVSQTWIAFAERVEPLDPQAGNGQKNRIRGRITAIDSGAPRIDLRLYQVLIGGRALVNGAPLSLQVDTGGAKIAFVPRYGRHGGHLDPSALTAGMFVEVDWHGLVPQPSVAAHKIGIRAAGQFEPLYRVAGRVERVDLTANALVLRKADGGRFWFGAESYPQIAVGMAADAILVEDRSGHATELELGQVEIGAAVSVLARRRSDADLTALLAVVDR